MAKSDDFKKARTADIKREYAPAPWAEEKVEQDKVSWSDVDGLLIAYLVTATSEGGASVQFTLARDGGALGVRIYDEAFETRTEWVRPGENAEELMFQIADYFRKKIGEEALRWS